jgi:hypothetical protein
MGKPTWTESVAQRGLQHVTDNRFGPFIVAGRVYFLMTLHFSIVTSEGEKKDMYKMKIIK